MVHFQYRALDAVRMRSGKVWTANEGGCTRGIHVRRGRSDGKKALEEGMTIEEMSLLLQRTTRAV